MLHYLQKRNHACGTDNNENSDVQSPVATRHSLFSNKRSRHERFPTCLAGTRTTQHSSPRLSPSRPCYVTGAGGSRAWSEAGAGCPQHPLSPWPGPFCHGACRRSRPGRVARVAAAGRPVAADDGQRRRGVLAVTGYPIGAVSPFGLSQPLPVYIDESVLAEEEISIGSGVRGTTVILRADDLRRALPDATVGQYRT